MAQPGVFDSAPALPEGFAYTPDLLSPEAERALLERLVELPFREFLFQGYTGKRRVVSFGWEYDFNDRTLREAKPLPDFLLPVREQAAAFAMLEADQLPHVLITEYAPGAGIGWHRDKGVFGDVVGISLGSACRFRLRRKSGDRWECFSLYESPALRPSGTEWEHYVTGGAVLLLNLPLALSR